MKATKTRCKQCKNVSKKATEKPCNKCSEIQHRTFKCNNHFEPKSEG